MICRANYASILGGERGRSPPSVYDCRAKPSDIAVAEVLAEAELWREADFCATQDIGLLLDLLCAISGFSQQFIRASRVLYPARSSIPTSNDHRSAIRKHSAVHPVLARDCTFLRPLQ